MGKLDIFFDEMNHFFLEKDSHEFEKLKGEMLEQIYIRMDKDETVDDILATFGSPKEIVDTFYENKKMIEEERIIEKNSLSHFKTILSFSLKVMFLCLIIFSMVCFIWNITKYHHISIIVLLIFGNSLFGLELLKDLKNKSIKRMSFFMLIFVMMSFFIMYSIHYKLFFYHGEVVNDSIELNHESIESLT